MKMWANSTSVNIKMVINRLGISAEVGGVYSSGMPCVEGGPLAVSVEVSSTHLHHRIHDLAGYWLINQDLVQCMTERDTGDKCSTILTTLSNCNIVHIQTTRPLTNCLNDACFPSECFTSCCVVKQL